jgi:GNAT superfamily N-acetyltransferase
MPRPTDSPAQPIFESAAFYARELVASEVPLLQALFDANPEYFLRVNGRTATPDEAQVEFAETPPPHLTYTKRWFAGLFDRRHGLVGVALVVSDLCAARVWHIALFLVATRLHGTGAASEIYLALEGWMRRSGARWLRLGVVQGNAAAERFWTRHRFEQVRIRPGVDTGGRINTIRMLVKPLESFDLASYLVLVPRDHPDSPLP